MKRKDVREWVSKWDIDAVILIYNLLLNRNDKDKTEDEIMMEEEMLREIRRRANASYFEEVGNFKL
ncbi:hypothetical protein [uncultured Anaerococcus sp.]|uniref:hypothetical protein n=1 Tax=uncultured Anaerococcus sp. TaxID=293428 RepID=UPI0028062971|nr:hypothetical protein [uncultured Anaerococcus sp.]